MTPNAETVAALQENERAKAERDLKVVTAFLCGEGTLDGRWFGDPPPTMIAGRPATYWWRKHLRAAVDGILNSEAK